MFILAGETTFLSVQFVEYQLMLGQGDQGRMMARSKRDAPISVFKMTGVENAAEQSVYRFVTHVPRVICLGELLFAL
ncbi:hypothetical protein [Pseudooceanicola sp.]|uniref:hypothetical protein n=1 Tax=Pseudooceanicola sp. TaxID=1914328 RepID=UPI0035C69EE6